MTADDLVNWMEAQNLGTRGETLFVGQMPPSVDAGVIVREYLASRGVRTMSGAVIEDVRVQIVSRAFGYETARQKAEDIYRACVSAYNQRLDGVVYLKIEPLQPPYALGEDETGRAQILFNVEVWKQQVPVGD
jgi:hypothetical protein